MVVLAGIWAGLGEAWLGWLAIVWIRIYGISGLAGLGAFSELGA